jgi:zinc/manganese transport system substrate-binding protein
MDAIIRRPGTAFGQSVRLLLRIPVTTFAIWAARPTRSPLLGLLRLRFRSIGKPPGSVGDHSARSLAKTCPEPPLIEHPEQRECDSSMLNKLRTVLLAGLVSLSPLEAGAASAKKLNVVASFSIIGDFARHVGGDRIDLRSLVGANGDPHVYEPRPADVRTIAAADIVLVNGLQFEGFLRRLIEASGTKAPVVELTKGVQPLKSTEQAHDRERSGHHHHHGDYDPHAWQAVPNARIYVKNIVDAFCSIDPPGCTTYETNAKAYDATLGVLDDEIRATIARIPPHKRVVITAHDAFGYFAHEYGLTFLAPEGLSTDAEAPASDIAALIRQIKRDKVAAVFVENIADPRLVQRIAAETGSKVGGELYSDALSRPDGPAATYVDLMKHNASTIRKAIAPDVP